MNDFNNRVNTAVAKLKKDKEYKQNKAKQTALNILNDSQQAPDNHPYLLRKKITNHNLKLYKGPLVIAGMACDGAIIVPLYVQDELHSLQFINASGQKRFLPGGRKIGCHLIIGDLSNHTICSISEGYATRY